MRVVVLGGYGNFGRFISKALAAVPRVDVVIAGRDGGRARDLASSIGGRAAAIDADAVDLSARLGALGADWVVHTAGPFQGADYRVARAAMLAGASYVDIADGRAFVCGITALDAEARERGVLLVSGASSVPALSSAAVDAFAPGFSRLEAIDIGIASSGRLPGRATVAGVVGYCGRPFEVWRDGRWTRAHGWQRPRRHRFVHPAFGRWISDCDVPDLALLPERHPTVRDVSFGAGAGGALAQAALYAASWWGRLMPLPAAGVALLDRTGRVFEALGPRRSGMFVRLAGKAANGASHEVCWELVAEGHEGRAIPAMGAVAVVRKALRGGLPAAGARPCVGLVDLAEYLAELDGLPVTQRLHERPEPAAHRFHL
jgi:hypothetical protein